MTTDRKLAEQLASLTAYATDSKGKPLPIRKTAKPIGAARGVAAKIGDGQTPAGGGGITSPLTETSLAARTYHATFWKDTTGLILMRGVSKFAFTDGAGNPLDIKPVAPP